MTKGILIGSLGLSLVMAGCSTLSRSKPLKEEAATGASPLASPVKSADIQGDSKISAAPPTPTLTESVTSSTIAAPSTLAAKDAQIASLSARLESMEGKLNALTQKLENLSQNQKASPTPVFPHGAHHGGTSVSALPANSDSESGFTQDEAVQSYRKAMILFRADRYSDSILGFSTFLEKYPDHPLAGPAQFYVGEAYFKQKEYKLALQEFQRVLTSYDRSPHVAQTLHDMAEAEDALKDRESAARHRQLLTSLFPHSPFATTEGHALEAHAVEAPVAPADVPNGNRLDEPPPTVPLVAPKGETLPATENEGGHETTE